MKEIESQLRQIKWLLAVGICLLMIMLFSVPSFALPNHEGLYRVIYWAVRLQVTALWSAALGLCAMGVYGLVRCVQWLDRATDSKKQARRKDET